MSFDIFNYLNCMIELAVLVLLWKLLVKQTFKVYEYAIAYVCGCLVSVLATFIDSVSFAVLPLNFFLIFLSMLAGFHRLPLKDVFLHTLFSYLVMIYFQAILVCVLPTEFIGTHLGNFTVNILVLSISLVLTCFSRHFHWADFYFNHKGTAWAFILALCVPEIVIIQVFVAMMDSASMAIMVILLLLQILYMTLVLLVFFALSRKLEHRQLADTQKRIESLNEHLEDSKHSMHDFNKHIRYLCNTVAVKASDDDLVDTVNAYCKDLLQVYEKEEILLQLNNPTFRALLYGRRTQAKSNHIEFILDASSVLPEFPVKNYQLVELFDNLMDNAFDAVEELPEEKRWIRTTLSVSQEPGRLTTQLLCIENPYNTLDFSAVVNEKKYTSKSGNHQGVGLQRVSRIVSDTGGQFIVKDQDNVFVAKIIYQS